MREDRYHVVAYVCEGGLVHEVNDMGYVAYRQVLSYNVHACRYAVMIVELSIRSYDLWDTRYDNAFNPSPGSYRKFPTQDAAIMACVLSEHTTETQ